MYSIIPRCKGAATRKPPAERPSPDVSALAHRLSQTQTRTQNQNPPRFAAAVGERDGALARDASSGPWPPPWVKRVQVKRFSCQYLAEDPTEVLYRMTPPTGNPNIRNPKTPVLGVLQGLNAYMYTVHPEACCQARGAVYGVALACARHQT